MLLGTISLIYRIYLSDYIIRDVEVRFQNWYCTKRTMIRTPAGCISKIVVSSRIEGQLRICNDYAERNGILIVDTYIDRAMTGTNDLRPDFQRMLKDSAKKQWNYVLVYKLDRFSRDKYETTIHKHTLKMNGVKVVSAMENIPDSPEGIILESLLEGMNQYYSAELSQKVKRGMYETRRKGHYQGGWIPYGYKLEGRKLVVDEDQAAVVRYMFEQYSMGVYVSKIISNLTSRGILYKGKPFLPNMVYGILLGAGESESFGRFCVVIAFVDTKAKPLTRRGE